MTVDDGAVNIRVDGNLVDSRPRDSGAGLPDQNDLFQLTAGESPGRYLADGVIDEVAICDKALDQLAGRSHAKNPGKPWSRPAIA